MTAEEQFMKFMRTVDAHSPATGQKYYRLKDPGEELPYKRRITHD